MPYETVTPALGQTPDVGTSALPSLGLPAEGPSNGDLEDAHKATERSPLLRSSSRRRRASVGPHGDATVTQAVLMVCTHAIVIVFRWLNGPSFVFVAAEVFRGNWYIVPWESVSMPTLRGALG